MIINQGYHRLVPKLVQKSMHVKTQKTSYKKTVFTYLPKIVMFVMFRNVEKCDKTIKQIPLYYLRFHKK